MLGGIQPYTAMVRGKAGALDDLMTHKQVSRLRLPCHRNVAHVDHRVLGMRVPLGSEDSLPAEGACPADGLANRHSLPARKPSHEAHMLYAVAMLASVALVLVNAFFVALCRLGELLQQLRKTVTR